MTVRGMGAIVAPDRAWARIEVMTTTLDTSPAAPIAMITPDPESDALRRRGLRRMRTLAVALLVFAAVVYLVTLGQSGFWATSMPAPRPRWSARSPTGSRSPPSSSTLSDCLSRTPP